MFTAMAVFFLVFATHIIFIYEKKIKTGKNKKMDDNNLAYNDSP
jgi:hypothetical protein